MTKLSVKIALFLLILLTFAACGRGSNEADVVSDFPQAQELETISEESTEDISADFDYGLQTPNEEPAVIPRTFITQEPTVPMYSVRDFFVLPEAMSYVFAPDAESLVFLAPVNGVINIFSRDIATNEATQLTFDEEQHIRLFRFVGETLLFTQDTFGDENHNIFRLNADGTKINLTPYHGRAMFLSVLSDEEILFEMNRDADNPSFFRTYRLNIITGEIQSADFHGLPIFDNDGVTRIIAFSHDARIFVYHRHSEYEYFEQMANIRQLSWNILHILAFDPSNEYIYALSNINRETVALVRMNPATGEEVEVIFEHEKYDLNRVMFCFEPGVLAGVRYFCDYFNQVFFNEEPGSIGAFYAQIFPHFLETEDVVISSISDNRNLAIVVVDSDVSRLRQYLFNKTEDTVTLLSDANFTTQEHMARMQPIRYTARDGLEIQGYLTLPVGVEPYNLPVVMIVHGGPHLRDIWLFDNEVQFLANRGYAVFQPNFRGSTGFGRSFVEAGFRRWGLTMQHDLTDGVLWLIEEGIADPDRIAIFGASYGGFAALAGATSTPDLYAAVVSKVGISSLFTFLESIPPHWEGLREQMHFRVGNPDGLGIIHFSENSPLYNVDQITAPLFIAHGANDVRTTLAESVQIVQALDERGVDVEFMVRWDEGHGFVNQQNILEFYSVLEAFLAEHLGGRTGNRLEDLDYTQTLEEVLAVME